MNYVSLIDPRTAETRPFVIQDVFGNEILNPRLCNDAALFLGDSDDAQMLLLVTPTLVAVPGTAAMATWTMATELPKMQWTLLAGRADAWDHFGVPQPNHGF